MRGSFSHLTAMGLFCLLAFFGMVSATMLESASAWAGDVATPMRAAPGMLKRTGREGPWDYGCAFPDKTSQTKGVTCTLGRILAGEVRDGQGRLGKGHPDALLMLLHATPDAASQKLGRQPWALAFLLPAAQRVDRAVPARLSVDNGAALSIPWQGCSPQGCSAQLIHLGDTVMESLKHGQQAQVVAQKPGGGGWSFIIRLDSLQAAMGTLDRWVDRDELKP